ncbi:MAG: thiamine diphosphokinase [Synergistes sp.]|nr:thiamine diphosphokinase [Synergistes sp.]
MKRCVIIGGAPIGNYEAVRDYLDSENDYYIYCDCGLKHREMLGADPDLIIGDFDSIEKPETQTEMIILPHVKDDTDTMFAAKEGARRGFTDFLLLGVIGARFDHSLANISMMLWLHSRGCRALLVDDYSEMEIVGKEPVYIPDSFGYYSLLAIDGKAEGLNEVDAFYSLENAELTPEFPLGVSNEALPGKTAKVWVEKGKLLLIKDRGGK